MRSKRLIATVALCAWVTTWSGHAFAQQQGDSSARLRLQLNQLTAENGRLIRENTEFQQQIDKLTTELAAVQESAERAGTRLDRAENTAQQFRQATQRNSEALEVMRERERELVAKFRETIAQLRDTEQQRSTLESKAADLDSAYASCAEKNSEMFTIGNEVLDVLDGRGPLKRMSEKEPFLQLSRVRLENLVDEYRYALEDQQVTTQDANP